MGHLPRYPVYVVTKGRHDEKLALTARFLIQDRVPFRVVVEPQEQDAYTKLVGAERVLVLPFSDLGQGSIPARNWIWEHAKASGAVRHWVLDDNIRRVERMWRGLRPRCPAGPAFAAIEDFADRYENVAIAGMAYHMFGIDTGRSPIPPYRLNCHLYSCLLILNALPQRWRGRYNEDTDLCLQVFADGWCTVQTNVFLVHKMPTLTMRGGNTDDLYAGDGRLRMARSLERVWPGVVRVDRRFRRPQHVVDWTKFTASLKRRADVDFSKLGKNEYGLKLRATKPVAHAADAAMLRELEAVGSRRSRKSAARA